MSKEKVKIREKQLKKNLIILFSVSASILLFLTLTYLFLVSGFENKQKDNEKYSFESRRAIGELFQLRDKLSQTSKLKEILNNIEINKAEFIGLKVDVAREMLQNFEKDFMLSDPIIIDISSPISISKLANNTLDIMQSNVNLSFQGINDVYLIRMIEHIYKNFPGYVDINNITLIKSGNLDQDIINQLKKGVNPALVKGTVKFNWNDVQAIENAN